MKTCRSATLAWSLQHWVFFKIIDTVFPIAHNVAKIFKEISSEQWHKLIWCGCYRVRLSPSQRSLYGEKMSSKSRLALGKINNLLDKVSIIGTCSKFKDMVWSTFLNWPNTLSFNERMIHTQKNAVGTFITLKLKSKLIIMKLSENGNFNYSWSWSYPASERHQPYTNTNKNNLFQEGRNKFSVRIQKS